MEKVVDYHLWVIRLGIPRNRLESNLPLCIFNHRKKQRIYNIANCIVKRLKPFAPSHTKLIRFWRVTAWNRNKRSGAWHARSFDQFFYRLAYVHSFIVQKVLLV
ncbi:hypothetical protein GFC29_3885 (plasmid) [Anoxybacillus sp. B7M1]|nr:hypothetical protein GFC29_3885 [Anoxybacillus sp. B7M1]